MSKENSKMRSIEINRFGKIGQEKKMGRNRSIDFYRYLMMIPICILHINYYAAYSGFTSPYPFSSGYLSVDFFFILSGFFVMKHFQEKSDLSEKKDPEVGALKYFVNRYKNLFPHHAYSFLMSAFFFVAIWKAYTFKKLLVGGFWEFLLVQTTGLGNTFPVNGVDWYLSALLIASFITYWLLLRNDKIYLHIIAPLSIFLIYAYFFHSYGDMNRYLQYNYVVCDGLLRGFADIGIGCIGYKVHKYLEPKVRNKFRIFTTFFEFAGFCLVFYVMYRGDVAKDFIVPTIMAVLLISVFNGNSYLSALLNNNVSAFLGKISLGVYLNQVVFFNLLDRDLKGFPFWPTMILYISVLTIYSFFTVWFVKKLSNVTRNSFHRLFLVLK